MCSSIDLERCELTTPQGGQASKAFGRFLSLLPHPHSHITTFDNNFDSFSTLTQTFRQLEDVFPPGQCSELLLRVLTFFCLSGHFFLFSKRISMVSLLCSANGLDRYRQLRLLPRLLASQLSRILFRLFLAHFFQFSSRFHSASLST